MQEHLLFEHVRGYELFILKEFEDLSSCPYTDYLALTQVINHVSSLTFTSPADVLSHIHQSEPAMEVLKNFLAMNNVRILHCDESLRNFVSKLGIECRCSPNIARGVRTNIRKILKLKSSVEEDSADGPAASVPLSPPSPQQIQSHPDTTSPSWLKQLTLSAAHAFSRDAVRYDLAREDNSVRAIASELESLEAEINTLNGTLSAMLERILPQHVKMLAGKKAPEYILYSALQRAEDVNVTCGADASEPVTEELGSDAVSRTGCLKTDQGTSEEKSGEKLLTAESICYEVIQEIDHKDLESARNIFSLLSSKQALFGQLEELLAEKMRSVAPNLRCILGDRLACRLISHVGGLMNLSLLPASTVQLLGAEKALFRSLKTRRPTPKYGIVYVLDSLSEHKGRAARYIAGKCSLAARIDAFEESRSPAYGEELKKLIDKRLRSFKNNKKAERTSDVLERVKEKLSERFRPKDSGEKTDYFSPSSSHRSKVKVAENDASKDLPQNTQGENTKRFKKAYHEHTKSSMLRAKDRKMPRKM